MISPMHHGISWQTTEQQVMNEGTNDRMTRYNSLNEESTNLAMFDDDETNNLQTERLQEEASQIITLNIDEAVDRIGHGKFQQLILFAAGTCFMADSMEIMLLSFLTLVLQNEWDWEGDHPIEIPIITCKHCGGGTEYNIG